MDLLPHEIHRLVVGTGRVSAAVFVLALLAVGAGSRAVALWSAFLAAHTVHYGAVAWFGVVNEGRDLFPGRTSFADAGGWPVVVAGVTLFYTLAIIGLAERRAGDVASRWLRVAGLAATTLIGLTFLAVYVPLVDNSIVFAGPALAIAAALAVYLALAMQRSRVDRP
jgi:hypothetical protein